MPNKGVTDAVNDIMKHNPNLKLGDLRKLLSDAGDSALKMAYYRFKRRHPELYPPKGGTTQVTAKTSPSKKNKDNVTNTKSYKIKSDNNPRKREKVEIPEDFEKIIKYTAVARNYVDDWKPSDTMAFFKSRNAFTDNPPRIIQYERPTFFTPLQNEIIDSIQLGSVAVEGDRQTGKTTAIYAGIAEDMIIHKSDWHFICSNGRNASNIFKKVVNDPLMQYLKEFYAINPTATKMSVFNNDGSTSTFTVHNTTVNDVKGSTGNLWIDEVDQVVKNNPEVIAAAAALTRSKPDLKLVFSMNKGTGAYRLLLDVLRKHEAKGTLTFITLSKEDSHIAEIEKDGGSNDEFIADIMEATMGEDYVRSQLLNEDTSNGDAFDVQSLTDALETYPLFTTQLPSVYYTYLAIDPSGTGHPVGWFLGGYDPNTEEAWEIESGEFRLGNPSEDGTRWSIQKMYAFFKQKAVEYNCRKIVCESNSGGTALIAYLRQLGLKAYAQNFGSNTAPNSHAAYIKLARMQFDDRKIYLKNKKLVNELLVYAPDKKNPQYKGDVADAFLHFVWIAYGGVRYIQNKYNDRQITAMSG